MLTPAERFGIEEHEDPTLLPGQRPKANVLTSKQTVAVLNWLRDPETRAWLDESHRTRVAIADKCALAVGFRVTMSNVESLADGAGVPLVPPAPAPEVPVTRAEFNRLLCVVAEQGSVAGVPRGAILTQRATLTPGVVAQR